MSIYPNPIEDYITLKSPELGSEDMQIEIFNLQGNKVFNSLIKPIQNVIVVDLNELRKGMYILKITDVTFQENHKIIKE